MAQSAGADDAKLLLDILSLLNNAINDQLALYLVGICRLSCFAKICKIKLLKNHKNLACKNFEFSISKKHILLGFQWISTILVSKSKSGYALFEVEKF